MSNTNGSIGSFAYTSNKNGNAPKYSPMRNFNPKHANQPMTYAAPPNAEEMMRDAGRHITGNRNFNQDPAYYDSRVTSVQQSV